MWYCMHAIRYIVLAVITRATKMLPYRADSRLEPSQWETSLQSNPVSHWLGANLELVLSCHVVKPLQLTRNRIHVVYPISRWVEVICQDRECTAMLPAGFYWAALRFKYSTTMFGPQVLTWISGASGFHFSKLDPWMSCGDLKEN